MDVLASLNIADKAAKIYLAGLALGTTSVQELARKTGLKRPTVYLHIDELTKQGLFETVSLNNKRYYRAAEPEVLESRLKGNLLELQSALPGLALLRANTMGKPQVTTFEGEEGVKRVYEEMKKANSLRVWSNMSAIHAPLHEEYLGLDSTNKK